MNKSIRVLKLPINIINQVESQEIYHIDELIMNFSDLRLAEEDIEEVRRSLGEYKKAQLHHELEGYKESNKYDFLNSKYKLENLNLSLRSMNALNNSGIKTISKLFHIIEQMEIYDVENLGTKSIIQVMESALQIVEKENLYDVIPIYSANNIIDDVAIEKMNFTQGAIASLTRLGLLTLRDIRKAYLTGELSNMFNYKTLNVVIKKVQKYYNLKPDPDFYFFKLYLIEEKLGSITYKELKQYIEDNNLDTTLKEVLEKLENRVDIIIENERIRLPFFLEKLKAVKLKKESEEILLDRFSGNTLQSVADRFNKTRERIRQIVRDRMAQIRMFYEEAFVKEYNKYVWHPQVFMKLFDLDELAFNVVKYLGNKYSFQEEFEFPEDYILELMKSKKNATFDLEKFKAELPEVFPPRIEIYGKILDKMTKREFLEYVIENFVPNEGLHKKEIIKIANKVSKENKLEFYYDKYIDIVTNTIQGLQNVRYYDYSRIDDVALESLKQILFEVDSVYSCTYFYLKHPELMQKYDIRDGYELHFILRRYFSEDEEILKIVDFNRQPMIAKKGLTFSDVVLQYWENLKEKVSIDDFADDLIEKHGFHRGTLINIINSTLGNYISLRIIYPYEAKLDPNIKAKVKEILTDDFYELQELADIFAENGIKEEQYDYFSNSWLNELGYKTHDINYVIKEEYSSLKEVFFNRVLKEDIYQITKKDHMMRETTLILFIENLREEYLAFPVKGNRLVTMKYLEKMGVKKSDVVKYVQELARHLEKEKYFTYFSLKKENYQEKSPIFKKMEDYKLDSSLMVSFIRNVPGVKKTTKGNLYRISKKPTTIAEFLDHISKTKGIEDPKELKRYVKENYGFTVRHIQ